MSSNLPPHEEDLSSLIPSGPSTRGLKREKKIIITVATVVLMATLIALVFFPLLTAMFEKKVSQSLPFGGGTPAPNQTPSVIGTTVPGSTAPPESGRLSSAIAQVTEQEQRALASATPIPHPPAIPGAAAKHGLPQKSTESNKEFQQAQKILQSINSMQGQLLPSEPIPASIPSSPPSVAIGSTPAPAVASNVPILSPSARTFGPIVTPNNPNNPTLVPAEPGQQKGLVAQTMNGLTTGQNAAFLQGSTGTIYSSTHIEPRRSRNEILPGDPIHCQLDTTINTQLPGLVIAHVINDVRSHFYPYNVLIPAGTELYGYQDTVVGVDQNRIQIRWDWMLFPTGATLPLQMTQADGANGQAGVGADVNAHVGRLYTTTLVGTLLSAAAALGTSGSSSVLNLLGQGAANNIAQTTAGIAQQRASVPPELLVHSGTRFTVRMARIQILPPYRPAEHS